MLWPRDKKLKPRLESSQSIVKADNTKKRSRKTFNVILGVFLLGAIVMSIVRITRATAPDPGHNFTEVGGGVAQGDILYGSAADTLAALAKNTTTARYLSNGGTNNNPDWEQIDLMNGVTGTLQAGHGGTQSSFVAFNGPTVVAKTFTLPNSNATILTSHDLVTVPQGGTGAAPPGDDYVLVSDSASGATWQQLRDCGGSYAAMTYTASSNTWNCNTDGGPHILLDATIDSDTLGTSVTRGMLIIGNATPKWSGLTVGGANTVLTSNGTDPSWGSVTNAMLAGSIDLTTKVTNALPVTNGGAGAAPGGDDQVLVSSSTSAAAWKTVNDCQGAGKALTYTQSTNAWGCNTISGSTNALLDGANHTDTIATTVTAGALVIANATPKWTSLTIGGANTVLTSNGTAPSWGSVTNAMLAGSIDLTTKVTGALPVTNGGNGAAPGATDQVLVSDSTSAGTWRTIGDCTGTGKAITFTAASNTWGCNTLTNSLLDASLHTDTLATTVTRGMLIVGNSTPKWAGLTVGGANTVLTSNGTDPAWSSGRIMIGRQVKVSGNTTYVPTSGTTAVLIQACGAGGGGAGANAAGTTNAMVGGGGGAGGYFEKYVTFSTTAASYTINIPAGGAGGVGGVGSTPGSNTTFLCDANCAGGAVTFTAFSGAGGAAPTATGTTVVPSNPGNGGAISTNGDLNVKGQPGEPGVRYSGTVWLSGAGGPSHFGGGGDPTAATAGGVAGGLCAGGSGAGSHTNANQTGGAGGAGTMIVWEFH